MARYANRSGDSGVSSYEIEADAIRVTFKKKLRTYRYSYACAGRIHVENMKQLALKGSGLNAYINKYVRTLYDR